MARSRFIHASPRRHSPAIAALALIAGFMICLPSCRAHTGIEGSWIIDVQATMWERTAQAKKRRGNNQASLAKALGSQRKNLTRKNLRLTFNPDGTLTHRITNKDKTEEEARGSWAASGDRVTFIVNDKTHEGTFSAHQLVVHGDMIKILKRH